jgi:hypothetical protein
MKTDWPTELIHAAACRRSVLFFGAGVSMNAIGKDGKTKTPSWAQFLKLACKEIDSAKKPIQKEIIELIDGKDYLTAAEVIRNTTGKPKFNDVLKKHFHLPDFRSASIHDYLFQLDLRIAITPNVDCIYESAVGKRGAGAVTVKNYYDDDVADSLRRHERVLIKSHGSIAQPSKIIFTRSDYAEARNKHADFYELLDALLRTHTFIFIGCGLDDPDIRGLLENYRYRHPSGQSHYFVAAKGNMSAAVKQVIQESMKINIVEYESTSDHKYLTSSLKNLVSLIEASRSEIAKSQSW